MPARDIHCVTGAFGFSGGYIAARLLRAGLEVRTLTNSPHRDHPLAGMVETVPYHFDDPGKLARSLEGVGVLYNTYWVRFNYRDFDYRQALANSAVLLDAAGSAGVRRIVHVSITNADEDSPLEYFSAKGKVERLLRETGIPYGVLRPALLFGREDILINNIAWMLRRLPFFPVFGRGGYRLRPIHVNDLAALAVNLGSAEGTAVIDAVGPETFTFSDLVTTIGRAIGRERRQFNVSPALGYCIARLAGWLMKDVVVTRDEIRGLMAGMLDVDGPPTGGTSLVLWLRNHAATIGRHYASELSRRYDRRKAYSSY